MKASVDGSSRSSIVRFRFAAAIPSVLIALSAGSLALAQTTLATLDGPMKGGLFGTSLASAGDIDGDGFPDLVIGAPGPPCVECFVLSRVYVYSGSDHSLLATFTGLASTLVNDAFGTWVA